MLVFVRLSTILSHHFFMVRRSKNKKIPEIVQKVATFSLGHLVDLFMIFVYMCKASLFGRTCLILRWLTGNMWYSYTCFEKHLGSWILTWKTHIEVRGVLHFCCCGSSQHCYQMWCLNCSSTCVCRHIKFSGFNTKATGGQFCCVPQECWSIL